MKLTFEKPLVGATKLDSLAIPKFLNAGLGQDDVGDGKRVVLVFFPFAIATWRLTRFLLSCKHFHWL